MLKKSTGEILGHLEDVNLFPLKFHMLDNMVENASTFGNLAYLNVSPYEHFKFTIKRFIRMTLMQKRSTTEDSVCVMNATDVVTEHIAL